MEILIICTHQQITATIARLIDSKNDWRATTAYHIEEAFAKVASQHFDVILIGSGISDIEEHQLREQLTMSAINTPVVKHYGGGSGLLYAEIFQATNL
jgi:DNA-binding NarL/FixJ family response regulator